MVVVATGEFSRRNQGCSLEEGLRNWARIAADARAAGLYRTVTIAAAFGCPFEGEVPTAHVLDLIRQVAESAPDEIALADTIGVGVPAQVRTLLDGAAEIAPGIPLRCHFHNTRNTGYANALTALDHGVSALDASTGGFGGCPFAPAATGNIATEDLVYALERTGIKTQHPNADANRNGDLAGRPPQHASTGPSRPRRPLPRPAQGGNRMSTFLAPSTPNGTVTYGYLVDMVERYFNAVDDYDMDGAPRSASVSFQVDLFQQIGPTWPSPLTAPRRGRSSLASWTC